MVAHQICRFLIAWNLRATGVTDDEISIGLAELEKFAKRRDTATTREREDLIGRRFTD